MTFGSPLEKTRFFFDRDTPTDLPPGTERFTDHVRKALASTQKGIQWYNAWYFRDVIADKLTSYDNVDNWDLRPIRLPLLANLTHMAHSDYLGDKEFMKKVAPLL